MVAKGEEIGIAGIAGDDQVGLRCGREGQHRVVRGIAADRCRQRRRIDDLGQPPQCTKRLLGIGLERARITWNFGRFRTSASSASNAGLLIRVSGRREPAPSARAVSRAKTSPTAAHCCQRPPARRRRPARTAFTSRSISSIDIGSMPASATRSAIPRSASAACRRLIASVSSRSSASDVNSPASRAARAGASTAQSEPWSYSLRG